MGNIIEFKRSEADIRAAQIPLEEWDGECWKALFDFFVANDPTHKPWDCLAEFIKVSLIEGK